MNFVNTTRCARVWSSVVFVALAISVFGWGLGYKLSLYTMHPSRANLVIQAKLLSKDERTVAEAVDLFVERLPAVTAQQTLTWCVALCFAALVSRLMAFVQLRVEPTVSWHRRRSTSLTNFFFRPPPVLN